MRLSREQLLAEATATGFLPESLEKVYLLLDLLEAINGHPDLTGKLALKGGTALNLFLFDVPRLSVDIDLNYIGSDNREVMVAERPRIEKAIGELARRLGITPQTPKTEHAGISWSFRYNSVLGSPDNIKVDVNYLLRVPLWQPQVKDSHALGSRVARNILVLDDHELAAGKLAALLARRTSRDLFDTHELLVRRGQMLDGEKLRLGFVVYGGINIEDWRTVSAENIAKAAQDLDTYLLPLLRKSVLEARGEPRSSWGEKLARECETALAAVLPLRENELAFLEALAERGEIEPGLLTADAGLVERLQGHPGLLWKALNVKKHKGITEPE